MDTYLPPIEKPSGLLMKLVYTLSRLRFGTNAFRHSSTSSSRLPLTFPASGPRSKLILTVYFPRASPGTRHECEQKPPHEKPVTPRLMILPSDERRKTSAEPSAARASRSAPTVQADK